MNKEKPNKPKRSTLHEYSRYVGLGFQIVAIMLICIGIGQWLDGYFEYEIPVFTLIFAFLAIGAIIYNLIKELS